MDDKTESEITPDNYNEYLIKDNAGTIKPILFNIYLMLRFHKDWQDVFTIKLVKEAECNFIVKKKSEPPYRAGHAPAPWNYTDTILTTIWLQQNKIIVTPDQVNDAIYAVALTRAIGRVKNMNSVV